jgi:hypothetical protein
MITRKTKTKTKKKKTKLKQPIVCDNENDDLHLVNQYDRIDRRSYYI